jgi:mannose-6-phosphate isomerase-like protein (cupin superfamily)
MPVGTSETMHIHRFAEQFFFILAGEATFTVDGKKHTISPHEGIHISKGTAHKVSNSGQEPLMFTVTSVPPSHGDRIEI